MSRSVLKILSAAFAACTVLALGAAPAPAASSSGAQTYSQNFCEDYGTYSVCSKAHGEYNSVETPSGNTMFQNNGKYEYTITINGAFYYSSKGSDHYQYLFKKNEVQENNYRSTQVFTQNGETCTYSYAYHFANGQVQFVNSDFDCVPV